MIELTMATVLTLGTIQEQNPKLDWWREARFGMFIHWGLYAIPAGTWEDETRHAEWIRTTAQIPLETYDQFVHEFNPVNFDADAWCAMANDAGMGYVVITSKHHDGFCLFESEHTEFDIMSTPFQRDIMQELAEAAPRHDVKMCWYHSIMDWHHPDYLPRRGWEKDRSADGADMQRYRTYLHSQVTELLTNYGPIGVMWFDGEWESTWRGAYGKELYELCTTLQPNVIVNNRLGARGGMSGLTGMDGYAGGYGGDYMTPEQEIPDAVDKGIDWETCMTMNDRWGYNIHDKNFKSTTDLLRKLSDITSKSGNFLLNVGPKPDGTFPDESIQRLAEIGDWMDVHGESIHGTIGSPFQELPWGRATQKFHHDNHINASTIYLHVFDWPEDGTLVVPGLAGDILHAKILGGDEVPFTMGIGEVSISVPHETPNEHVSVIALEVKGKPVVYEKPKVSTLANEFVSTLEVTLSVESEELDIRYWFNNNRNLCTYIDPIVLDETTTIHAQTFDGRKSVSPIVSTTFRKVTPWTSTDIRDVKEGVTLNTYEGVWDELPNFSTLTPTSVSRVAELIEAPEQEHVARVFEGYVRVDENAMYEFALSSDDGSRLLIDENVVVDNDGLHGTQEKRGSAPLAKGLHRFRLEWFNKEGGASLQLKMGLLGAELRPIPPTSLVTPK